MSVSLIYDSAYLKHETGVHPENARRLEAILAAIEKDESLAKRLVRVAPSPAHNEDIARCHREELIYHLESLCERGETYVDEDTRVSPYSFEVARLAAGAATNAVDLVMKEEGERAFCVIRPPGHHATITNAMGFCLFNNAAIGARYAQAKYGVERVLIVDWDVHHGNGTQEIFWNDPTVFYFSTHQYPYYPGTGSAGERGAGKGEGTTLNIPLSMGTLARDHRQAFTDALHVIERHFPPDLVIVSAGFDSRRGDPLGGLMLEDADFSEMTKEVVRLAEKHASGRVIGLLEGGYGLDLLGGSVRSHISALL
ncbi:MAG TPA: histone deacetylase [Terriglobia bacterium]|nr:histone deacetylase [Terriglobia bacterium]